MKLDESEEEEKTHLLLRHGKAEVCNDRLQLHSHCRLDLWPWEHLNIGVKEKAHGGIVQNS